jgi:hypothetical protein
VSSLDAVITGVKWISSGTIQVDFESHHSDRWHQIYSGRRLIGVTSQQGERAVSGMIVPSSSPSPLQVVAVDSANRMTDYGRQLPIRPYNQFELSWSAVSMDADCERYAVFVPTEFGGEPDSLLRCVESVGNGNYTTETPVVDQSGDWTYSIQPIDDAAGDDPITEGNYGTASEVTVRAKVYPPDFAYDASGSRFAASSVDGQLTVSVAYGWSSS